MTKLEVGESYRCHEDVCTWGYQYCDEVVRRCSGCHDKLPVCFKSQQEPNCTLLCLDTFYPGQGAEGLICEGDRNLDIWRAIAIVLIIVTTLCVGLVLYSFRKYILGIFGQIFTQRKNQSISSDEEALTVPPQAAMNEGLLADYRTAQEQIKETWPIDAKDRVRCELSLNVATLEAGFITLTPVPSPEGEKTRFVFSSNNLGN